MVLSCGHQCIVRTCLLPAVLGDCINALNAFQVATDAKGRGVLRLLLLQQQINILEVPVICAQLALLAFPDWRAPVAFCTIFDIITRFTLMVRYMSNFAIALGR